MVERCLTKLSMWWLRYFEELCFFWPTWSYLQAILILLIGICKGWELIITVGFIFVAGIIVNAAGYFAVRTFQAHLHGLEDGPEKEDAHALMTEIIMRRIKK